MEFKRTKTAEGKILPRNSSERTFGRGRPPKFDKQNYPELAFRLLLLGYGEQDLAKYFEVDGETIKKWKQEWPDFSLAVEKANASVSRVAKKLWQRACGYQHPDTKVFLIDHEEELPDGTRIKTKKPLLIDVIKCYPPDTEAAKFLLWNKTKSKTGDRQWMYPTTKMEVTGQGGGPISFEQRPSLVDLSDLTLEELKLLKKIGVKSKVPADDEPSK